jgi:predicted AAA+ superfamily ATPase
MLASLYDTWVFMIMTSLHGETAKPLREVPADFPIVVIKGMRQAGKTILLHGEPFGRKAAP